MLKIDRFSLVKDTARGRLCIASVNQAGCKSLGEEQYIYIDLHLSALTRIPIKAMSGYVTLKDDDSFGVPDLSGVEYDPGYEEMGYVSDLYHRVRVESDREAAQKAVQSYYDEWDKKTTIARSEIESSWPEAELRGLMHKGQALLD